MVRDCQRCHGPHLCPTIVFQAPPFPPCSQHAAARPATTALAQASAASQPATAVSQVSEA